MIAYAAVALLEEQPASACAPFIVNDGLTLAAASA
jgi:hypothetical protein